MSRHARRRRHRERRAVRLGRVPIGTILTVYRNMLKKGLPHNAVGHYLHAFAERLCQ